MEAVKAASLCEHSLEDSGDPEGNPTLPGLSAPNCQTKAQGLPVVTFPVALALGPPFLEDPMTSCSSSEPASSLAEDAVWAAAMDEGTSLLDTVTKQTYEPQNKEMSFL